MTALAMSIKDFCVLHGISKNLFYKLEKEGCAPKTIDLGKRRLITTEAAAEWRASMQQK